MSGTWMCDSINHVLNASIRLLIGIISDLDNNFER